MRQSETTIRHTIESQGQRIGFGQGVSGFPLADQREGEKKKMENVGGGRTTKRKDIHIRA